MATKRDIVPGNAPGKFYNDLSCIDCGMCPDAAPLTFRRNDEEGYSYVYRQPTTPEEIAAALDVLEACPSQSIGNDGDQVS